MNQEELRTEILTLAMKALNSSDPIVSLAGAALHGIHTGLFDGPAVLRQMTEALASVSKRRIEELERELDSKRN